MKTIKTSVLTLWMIMFLVFLNVSSAFSKEAGFSLKEDPGLVTFKDIRLTLPNDWGSVNFNGRNRTRYEAWDYFAGATDNDYEFLANQLRLGARWTHDIFNVNYTHQYTQLSNLPTATSAGAGSGSLYFSNSRDRNAHGQEVKYLNLELKQPRQLLKPLFGDLKWLRGITATVGRYNYMSGNEMKSDDAKQDWLKSQRIADRLIGGFEWSHFGRSFDGWKVGRSDDNTHINIAGFSPTQGGFEESAHRSIQDIDLFAVEANVKKDKLLPGMEAQIFYYHYDDHRNIAVTTSRFDNTGRALRAGEASDIEIHTFGGHLVGNYKVGPGNWDVLGWGALQQGDWFELDQSSYAFAAETGYQFTQMPWTPWIRGGMDVGSGDEKPGDSKHGTFFQMLPTARQYSYAILYNMMNTQDTFVSLILKPKHNLTLRTEFHDIQLEEGADRWYLGSGPMHDNILDDYAARSSNAQSHLGQLLDVTAIWNANPDVTVIAYYGHFFGDDVTEKFFTTQSDANMAFLEVAVQF